jgi:hypothetical protein
MQPNGRFKKLEGNYSTYRLMVSRGLMADPFQTQSTKQQPAAIARDTTARSDSKGITESRERRAERTEKKTVQGQSEKNSAPGSLHSAMKPRNSAKTKKRSTGFDPDRPMYGTHNLTGDDAPEKPFVETHVKPRETKPKRKRKFTYRKVSDIEQEIADHESMVETLEAMMMLPETLRDGNRVRELTQELDELRLKLRQLYDHWDEASELN